VIADLALPTALRAAATDVVLRRAVEADLAAVVGLLADDPVSATRGDVAAAGDLEAYRSALVEVVGDPANELLVVEDASGAVVATMQLTRIPGMARRGSARLQVEAVRVGSTRRSGGIGAAMMRWVTETAAPAVGATLVQLTSDEARRDAHRFYERLGFTGSHRGFKLPVV
jgi:GNAT superfamily N-acetyltransferase